MIIFWGGRIRTFVCRLQRAMPYRLATPQQSNEIILKLRRFDNKESLNYHQGKKFIIKKSKTNVFWIGFVPVRDDVVFADRRNLEQGHVRAGRLSAADLRGAPQNHQFGQGQKTLGSLLTRSVILIRLRRRRIYIRTLFCKSRNPRRNSVAVSLRAPSS